MNAHRCIKHLERALSTLRACFRQKPVPGPSRGRQPPEPPPLGAAPLSPRCAAMGDPLVSIESRESDESPESALRPRDATRAASPTRLVCGWLTPCPAPPPTPLRTTASRRRRRRARGRPMIRRADLRAAEGTRASPRGRARGGPARPRGDADGGLDRAEARGRRGPRHPAREDQADDRAGSVGRRPSERTRAVRPLDQRLLRLPDRHDARVQPACCAAQGDRPRRAHDGRPRVRADAEQHGRTDDFGSSVLDGGVHVHDLHATILHLMGVDRERLTYRYP